MVDGTWQGPIQLVLCHDSVVEAVRIGSCGSYVRESDGKVGQMIRYRQRDRVRVVVALSGKTLKTKTFLGPMPPPCGPSLSDLAFYLPPPWHAVGDPVPTETIDAYAKSVAFPYLN